MIKIAVLGITGILLALFLKDNRPVFAVLISMASCMLIFFCAVENLGIYQKACSSCKATQT